MNKIRAVIGVRNGLERHFVVAGDRHGITRMGGTLAVL
jgi:hypothetical protein